jgi:hypothetical protein
MIPPSRARAGDARDERQAARGIVSRDDIRERAMVKAVADFERKPLSSIIGREHVIVP